MSAPQQKDEGIKGEGIKDEWWFRKMIKSRTPLDTPSKTQSKLLSELDSVYELQSKPNTDITSWNNPPPPPHFKLHHQTTDAQKMSSDQKRIWRHHY